MKRKLCVVTGGRAEYGLLYWLMKEIQEDDDLELQVVVTGMHLSPEYGTTANIIENDGFPISAKVESLLSSDTAVGVAKSVGLGVIGFADAFERLSPDLVVLLGDRYEILAAAQAALFAKIRIAHLSGGETTEGAFDEAIRHSITKMAHLHFVAAEPYRQRVIQLGEHPDTVFRVGAFGLDNIQRLPLLDRKSFEESIDFQLGSLNFLLTYHPVTLQQNTPEAAVIELLEALKEFPEAHIIVTGQNSDPQGRIIQRLFEEYATENSKVRLYKNLGQLRYLSAIQHCDLVIGNSSSGVIEVPAMKKPTINLGDRQKGRLKAQSIIDCSEDKKSIVAAIQKGLSADFQESLQSMEPILGTGNVAPKVKEVLKNYPLETPLLKTFHDHLPNC